MFSIDSHENKNSQSILPPQSSVRHHSKIPRPLKIKERDSHRKATLTHENARLRHDYALLERDYAHQKAVAAEAERALHQAHADLEELSQQLFEEANEMVARARREHNEAKRMLEITLTKLADEQQQLSKAKMQLLLQQGRFDPCYLAHDHDALNLFRDFVQQARETELSRLQHLPFLRMCIDQDVLPCLQLGSSKSPKRWVPTLIQRACAIEPALPETPTPSVSTTSITSFKWSLIRRQSPALYFTCFACGRQRTYSTDHYRFRLNQDSWHSIDQPCRDRLVSVCDFFAFVRYLKQGLHGQQRTIDSLFHESIHLRLSMFCARTGTIYT
ncbi:hypothetical protein BCR43DRAFT_512030 [Syncephalastrum racemosum]|uniref:GDP/GTP exchange factor Sec2 N-terminal domain-containing protein n=1 Tax=Syncephalastrum racemosum TaxID=13706 RepID=A0A1X2HP37_SYNRA|nr:hypothetical protein BCR43DRAFT_512030 [Syncephalastrum racemosum]